MRRSVDLPQPDGPTSAVVLAGCSVRSTRSSAAKAAPGWPKLPKLLATPLRATRGGPLRGKSLVITGTLSVPRDEVIVRIEAAGGKVTGSLSKKTDYLVAGEDPGSKVEKAKQLGVAILDEAGLDALIGGARS